MVQNPMVLHHARRGIAGKSRMNLIGHVAKWVEFTRTLDGFEPRRHDGHNGALEGMLVVGSEIDDVRIMFFTFARCICLFASNV
jgi:hypothetical protein